MERQRVRIDGIRQVATRAKDAIPRKIHRAFQIVDQKRLDAWGRVLNVDISENIDFDTKTYKFLAVPGVTLFERRKGTIVDSGNLTPDARKSLRSGPIFVVANHPKTASIFHVGYAVREALKRPTTMVMRHTLLDPNAEESEKVKNDTGNKNDIFNKKPETRKEKLVRHGASFFLRRIGDPISIIRGEGGEEYEEKIPEAIANNEAIGIFLLDSRTHQANLLKAKSGIAQILLDNPNVPMLLLGISEKAVGSEVDGNKEEVETRLKFGAPIKLKDVPLEFRNFNNPTADRRKIHDYIVLSMHALIVAEVGEIALPKKITQETIEIFNRVTRREASTSASTASE